MPTTGYFGLDFQRSGTIPTTYTDLLLTTAPADSVVRKSLYIGQFNCFLFLGTVGNGVKVRCLRSDDNGVTWQNNWESANGLLVPANFANKSAYFNAGAGSSGTTWFKLQIASLDSALPAANAVVNALAFYEF